LEMLTTIRRNSWTCNNASWHHYN